MSQIGSTGVVDARQVDDLKFFKNFFVTGDYYIAGVGLKDQGRRGFSNGSITVPADIPSTPAVEGVPRGADILAAYLYWQVVSDTGPDEGALGVKFRGFDLSLPDDLTTTGVVDPKPFGKILASAGTAACFNPGGGTGDNGSARRTYTYRMDVLRFFGVEGPGNQPRRTICRKDRDHRQPSNLGARHWRRWQPDADCPRRQPDVRLPRSGQATQCDRRNDDGVTLGNAQRT